MEKTYTISEVYSLNSPPLLMQLSGWQAWTEFCLTVSRGNPCVAVEAGRSLPMARFSKYGGVKLLLGDA